MGMLICYEAIFPDWPANARRGRGTASQHQQRRLVRLHLCAHAASSAFAHARRGAGRYVVRATNSGITAVLDPLGGMHALGSEKDHYALFKPGSLTATALALQGHTPYFYLHPWLPAAGFVMLALLCLPLVRQWRRRSV